MCPFLVITHLGLDYRWFWIQIWGDDNQGFSLSSFQYLRIQLLLPQINDKHKVLQLLRSHTSEHNTIIREFCEKWGFGGSTPRMLRQELGGESRNFHSNWTSYTTLMKMVYTAHLAQHRLTLYLKACSSKLVLCFTPSLDEEPGRVSFNFERRLCVAEWSFREVSTRAAGPRWS